ncbi:uncharacterized protein E0L32_011951 [Thyridium curvatum]|uniref:C2H2-type domain-containing protein n=1 Tax=Thyridium curvatum TaxID=1093900 RepID=A0A507BET3_9PEZI|nr:uncharacterized protein E0L32_011951 [Thyridium curvatum]TPX17983.1 hypothetical protein E0L32_011951 [Thyridium curvatum]
MASEKGPIATEAPLVAAPALASAAPTEPEPVTVDVVRANSLKRPREATPTSPSGVAGGHPSSDLSPTKIARLVSSAARHTPPPPLTAAAALEDEQRRREEEARLHPPDAISDNPAQRALAALMSPTLAMSRPQDAPAAAPAAPEADHKLIDPAINPSANATTADQSTEPNAQSSAGNHSIGAGAPVTHSPAPMEVDSRNDRPQYLQPETQAEDKAGSMSYPGVLPPSANMPAPSAPQRGMSLPMPSAQNPEAPRSPSSSKKHKCPYCDTEFTRHHNLKSHLLTHSQEKPYVCQECQMRFRRLHDLKRHSKLHTGEKPHICPKCDRKFARGDALARHSKGAGGCAGRRSSMGSFAGDDYDEGVSTNDADDSVMSGVTYDGVDTDMTEEERRRLSLPSIKAQHVSGAQAPLDGYSHHSRTYPPAGARASTAGGLYPPNVERGSGSSSNTSPSIPGGHTPSTSISSMPTSAGATSMYSHGMTESPKPLSPSMQQHQAGHDPHRQHDAAGRRPSDLSAPHGTSPESNVNPLLDVARFNASSHSGAPQGAAMPPSQQHPIGAHHSRTSSGHAASGGSGDSAAHVFPADQGMWSVIQSLEERLRQREERDKAQESTAQARDTQRDTQIAYLTSQVNTLSTENSGLREQLAAVLHKLSAIENEVASLRAQDNAAPMTVPPVEAVPPPVPMEPKN